MFDFDPFLGPGHPQPPSAPLGGDPSGAEALYRGLELLFRGLADLQNAGVALPPNVPLGAPTPDTMAQAFRGGPGPSLYPGMEDTPDDFSGQYHAPFPAPQPPAGYQSPVTGETAFALPDSAGLAAFLRSQGVPEHQIAQAMSAAPSESLPGAWPTQHREAMLRHAAEAAMAEACIIPVPPPPAPTPFPTPDSQCEEAQQQRQDATRVPKLRADPQLFLEKIYYYLSQIAAKRDAATTPDGACDVPQLRADYGDFIDERVECIDCLPGTCPRFPFELPPPSHVNVAAGTWDECYALLRELIAQGICDAEDEAAVLAKMGDRPVPRPEFAPDAPLPDAPPVNPLPDPARDADADGDDPEASSAVA